MKSVKLRIFDEWWSNNTVTILHREHKAQNVSGDISLLSLLKYPEEELNHFGQILMVCIPLLAGYGCIKL